MAETNIGASVAFECPEDRQNLIAHAPGDVTCGSCGREFAVSVSVTHEVADEEPEAPAADESEGDTDEETIGGAPA